MKIEIENLDRCIGRIEIKTDKITGELVTAMKRAGAVVKGEAQRLCRVGTYKGGGQLRESIHTKTTHTASRAETVVYTNAKHAPFVEFGTGPLGDPKVAHTTKTKWVCRIPAFAGEYGEKDEGWRTMHGSPPRPFLYPALERNRALIVRIIKEGMRK